MNERIINVKGLEHSKREKLIFSAIDSAKKGDCFKLIVEFNPIPLVYMLKGMKDFNIKYEKEGPDEWILDVMKISSNNKKEELKNILKELKKDDVSAETKQKAKKILKGIDATTIGLLEQELIREGISAEEIKNNLCDLHLEAIGDELIKDRIEVKSPHPIHTLMEEHKLIVEGLEKLNSIVEKIGKMNSYSEFESEIPELKKVAHLLIDAENHHKREEEVLFPMLRKHNIVEPPNIMEEDHKEFIKRKRELFKVVNNLDNYDFEEFKKKVIEHGIYLVKELKSHIFKEDNILYQMALQALSKEEWREIKKENDKIGYCCFKPEDQK